MCKDLDLYYTNFVFVVTQLKYSKILSADITLDLSSMRLAAVIFISSGGTMN